MVVIMMIKVNKVDFGTNRFFHLNGYCYYAGDDGTILTGGQTINGMDVYFENTGVQVKGRFISDYSGKNFAIMIRIPVP